VGLAGLGRKGWTFRHSGRALATRPFAQMPAEEIFARVAAIGARTDTPSRCPVQVVEAEVADFLAGGCSRPTSGIAKIAEIMVIVLHP
jgi:hypothetical protein